MSDVLDKVLGVSGGVSAVLSFVFYKYYKSKGEFAGQVQKIPVFQPDGHLYESLNKQDDGCWAYAGVEGDVKDLGRTISSHHGPVEGVVMKTKLVEHKSKRINGFWSESKKDLRDNIQSVPFALYNSGNESNYKVELVDPQTAAHLQEEMDLTYDRFEPHKSGIVEIGLDRLFGEVTKGIQETETMLINGTPVLALGRVFLERGRAKLGPPHNNDNHFYIITKMSLGELVRSYQSQSKTFKALAIVSALLGSGLLLWFAWRNVKKWLVKREQRLQFDNIRRALQSRDSTDRNTVSGDTVMEDSSGSRSRNEENCCVVCLTNERQVIALPCGHVSVCLSCAEVLPSPKKCPICRADVERFMQAFYS